MSKVNKYTNAMCLGIPVRLFLLPVATGLVILHGSALAVNMPAKSGQTSSSRSADTLETYLSPSQQVVQELQSGLSRIHRMCAYGPVASPNMSSDIRHLTDQFVLAREQLQDVQLRVQTALADFRQRSSLGSSGYCRYVPEFSVLGLTCQSYRQDAAKLNAVTRVADRLASEASARLDIYERYVQLEARGCTRSGFVVKLWQTEQQLLWPSVLQAPDFFKTQLVPAK